MALKKETFCYNRSVGWISVNTNVKISAKNLARAYIKSTYRRLMIYDAQNCPMDIVMERFFAQGNVTMVA